MIERLRHEIARCQLSAAAEEWRRREEEDTPAMMELAERVRFWGREARENG